MIIFLKLKHSEFQGFMSPLPQANSSLPEPPGKPCAMFRGFLEVTKINKVHFPDIPILIPNFAVKITESQHN